MVTEEIEPVDGVGPVITETTDWVGEPATGMYDENTDDEDEEEAVMMDVMDQDSLDVAPSDRDEKMEEDDERHGKSWLSMSASTDHSQCRCFGISGRPRVRNVGGGH
jgi:hypothetical protein